MKVEANIMDRQCVKCGTNLTAGIAIYGGDGKFAAYKEPYTDIKSRKTATEIRPYICSKCGYIEWYADKPENFK